MTAMFKLNVGILLEASGLLPPGNRITRIAMDPDGVLDVFFDGIDAPYPLHGEIPEVSLMIGISPNGQRSNWIQPKEKPEPVICALLISQEKLFIAKSGTKTLQAKRLMQEVFQKGFIFCS